MIPKPNLFILVPIHQLRKIWKIHKLKKNLRTSIIAFCLTFRHIIQVSRPKSSTKKCFAQFPRASKETSQSDPPFWIPFRGRNSECPKEFSSGLFRWRSIWKVLEFKISWKRRYLFKYDFWYLVEKFIILVFERNCVE